jgi:integrase
MAREVNRLSVVAMRNAGPGMHHDGRGLYLNVAGGSKSWLLRYVLNKRTREMGLGSAATITLAEARQKALECRKLLEDGVDPIERRNARRAEAQIAGVKAMTFDEARDAYLTSHRAGWRSIKHTTQWVRSLEVYVTPVFGGLPVEAIDTRLVTKVLEPVWSQMPETAGRIRGRIEAILDWAKARGYREGENPARWRGHLEQLLPSPRKVRRVEHYAALPYTDLGTFLVALRDRPAIAARALEFLILTAARTGEVLGMRWAEVDLKAKTWVVPAERMKGHREHRVPLSDAAVRILERLERESEYVFPGSGRACLSETSMLKLMRRMGHGRITSHGFRSSFSDWAAEQTHFPREVCEAALAHMTGNDVERAYRRGDQLEKRRKLMQQWATFCSRPSATGVVVPLNPREASRELAAQS